MALWDPKSVARFFQEQGLQSFYQNNERTDTDFSLYLRLKRLRGYKFLGNDLKKLKTGRTCIMYIKVDQTFSDENYNDHLRAGGIFLSGGRIIRKKYTPFENRNEWTHIQLVFGANDDNGPNRRVYTLKLGGKYIFYKIFRENWRDQLDKIDVQLIE